MIRDFNFVFEGDEESEETIYLVAVYRKEQKSWISRDEFENIDDAKKALEDRRSKFKGLEFEIFKYVKTESICKIN